MISWIARLGCDHIFTRLGNVGSSVYDLCHRCGQVRRTNYYRDNIKAAQEGHSRIDFADVDWMPEKYARHHLGLPEKSD